MSRATDIRTSENAVRRDGRRLRWLALLMLGAAMAVAIVGLTAAPYPAVLPTLLFGGTMAAAEHRDRLFGDETSVSGSFAVALATVLVFARGSWLTGPMVCAAFAGCYWPHIRARAWSRIAVNTSAMSLAAAGSATVVHLLVTHHGFNVDVAAAGVIALAVFWIVNSAVLAAALASIQQRRLLPTTWKLVGSDVGLLPFGYIGFLSGALAPAGVVDVWLALLAVLVLLNHAVIEPPQRNSMAPLIWSILIVGATSAGIAVTMTTGAGNAVPLLAAGGLVSFASAERLRPGVGIGVVTAAAVAAAIMLQGTQPVAGTVLVGVATCLPMIVHCTTIRAAVRCTGIGAAASLSVGLVAVVYQEIGVSIIPALTFGLIAGGIALLSWHAAQGAWLIFERKRHLYRSAVDVCLADAPIALIGGLLGGLAGWGSIDSRPANVVLAAVLGLVVLRVVTALRRTRTIAPTAEADLLDVVRSAVLDLPASKLPDGVSETTPAAR